MTARYQKLVFLLLLSLPLAASAAVSISGLDPIRIDAWVGSTGNLTGSDTYCTVACTGSCNRNSRRRDYDSAVYTNGQTDWAGNFYISNGSQSMLVYLDWTHPVNGTTRMSNYNVTGRTTGRVEGAYSCADSNSQTRIDITVPAWELASASAGTYSETFMVDVCRLNDNNSLGECFAAVNFSVTLPELVQISRLDNIELGEWNGTDNIQETEPFCVYRNDSGGFSLNINSSNASGGNFNVVGTDTAPYTLELSQGGGYTGITPGVTTSGFAGSSTRDCGNDDNITLRLSMDAADLQTLSSGSFADTIVIIAEPN